MSLTRQHFVLIAKVLADLDIPATAKLKAVNAFSDALQSLNPLFDAKRFKAFAYPEVFDKDR